MQWKIVDRTENLSRNCQVLTESYEIFVAYLLYSTDILALSVFSTLYTVPLTPYGRLLGVNGPIVRRVTIRPDIQFFLVDCIFVTKLHNIR